MTLDATGSPATIGLNADEVRAHSWCSPGSAPTAYRGPHAISTDGWENFARRLERGEERSVIRSFVAGHERVLDVGGGTGEYARVAAAELGHVTTVEPHQDRLSVLRGSADGTGGTVEVHPGRAESLPFADGAFDAVYIVWVLPYVDDLEASLHEAARVTATDRPDAEIAVICGAHDSELIGLLNAACVPLAGEPLDHEGFLLASAARVFAEHGFDRFDLRRTESTIHFPEVDLDARVDAAAAALADLWYSEHPAVPRMRAELRPHLLEHFARRPHAVGDQATTLIARRAGRGR